MREISKYLKRKERVPELEPFFVNMKIVTLIFNLFLDITETIDLIYMYVPLKMSDGPKHKTVYRGTNDVDHFRELRGIEINRTLFPTNCFC
jgi:N12 class adenine-specific DNA methylase